MLPTQEAEGLRLKAYNDTVGVKTIGYGHNLNNPESKSLLSNMGLDYNAVRSGQQSITKGQADQLFEVDHAKAEQGARRITSNFGKDFDSQPGWVKNILTDMTFNLGEKGLSNFKQSLSSMLNGNYKAAAQSLSQSKWAQQTGQRARAIISDLQAGYDTYARQSVQS